MRAVKAIYDKGRIELSETPENVGRTEVLVVFPESATEAWEAILSDSAPRPALEKYVEECKKEIAAGTAKPLNVDDL